MFDFQLESIFAAAPVATNNELRLKVVKIDPKIIILLPWSKSVTLNVDKIYD